MLDEKLRAVQLRGEIYVHPITKTVKIKPS
jgi:hypothetical protein